MGGAAGRHGAGRRVPPHERGGHRLVDGLALVPVPTGAVLEDGADLAVSVNLIGAEMLAGVAGAARAGARSRAPARGGMLDTLLEVMDLSQLETSARHAELADVAITPRFGPAHWRDFHLADLFLAAGRRAAVEQLPALQALSTPVDLPHNRNRRRRHCPSRRSSHSRISSGSSWTAWASPRPTSSTTARRPSKTWASTRSPSWRSSSPCSRITGSRIPDEDAEEIHSVGEAIDYVNRRLAEQE